MHWLCVLVIFFSRLASACARSCRKHSLLQLLNYRPREGADRTSLGQLLMPGGVATLRNVVTLIVTMWMVGKGQFSQSSRGDAMGSTASSLMQVMWC